jgi:hypothetical protein
MDRLLPDLGHSSLQVVDGTTVTAYASFWPDPSSFVGEFTHHFHLPPTHYPVDYVDEVRHDGYWMRRKAENELTLEGLDEQRIIASWEKLSTCDYDIRHWNCSDVTKFLILHSMDEKHHAQMEHSAKLTRADLHAIRSFTDVRLIVQYLATKDFIDTRPGDTLVIATEYNRIWREDEKTR